MKAGFDLAASVCKMHVVATWAIRPPLVSTEALIGVVLGSCVVLFWVRSSAELRQQMYDRLYGPGMKAVPLRWWEADLDPLFKRSVQNCVKRWMKKQR